MAFDKENVRTPEETGPAEQKTNGAAQAEETQDAKPSVAELESQLNVERARAEDYLKNWQRAQADFINFRRRNDQERAELVKFANGRLILQLLPALDDLDRAVEHMPEDVAQSQWGQGLLLIDRKLRAVLEKEGLKPVEAVGSEFDPNFHEAVVHEEAGAENSGKVVDELQKGYMLGDRLLRPSLVKVGK